MHAKYSVEGSATTLKDLCDQNDQVVVGSQTFLYNSHVIAVYLDFSY